MNTIEKLQNDLGTWYESSSIYQFMHWWKTELKSFVPNKYQEQLFPQAIEVFLTGNDENIEVWSKSDGVIAKSNKAETISGEEVKWWHQVQNIINQAEGKQVTVKYLLSNDEALTRKIALPEAAKDNLEDVIGFELDKYVPFNLEQVQLSYKIDKQNTSADKILIDLAVIPKQKVNEVLSLCDDKSISLDGIDVNITDANNEPSYLGVNLLPLENRKKSNYFNIKLNAGLLFLLIVLIYFVMHTSLANKQDKIDRLSKVNAQLQKQSRTSKKLRKELKEVIVSSKFLQTKKANHPAIVSIFSEITSTLPDDTYIVKFKINQNRWEFEGRSDSASNLVPELDKSENWFEPQTVGRVTKDPRTNKEKFTIKADLQEPKPEAEDGKNS